MGHESRIEPWSPHLTTCCFAGFGTNRLRCEEAMKTADRENPNRLPKVSSNRAHGAARSEQILLHHVGCEARKTPADAGVFFLDFPFYRTNQELASLAVVGFQLFRVNHTPKIGMFVLRLTPPSIQLTCRQKGLFWQSNGEGICATAALGSS